MQPMKQAAPLIRSRTCKSNSSYRPLIKNGASPVQQDMYGRTALHEAVEISEESIILVRNAGGNPLAKDAYGKTPLASL